MSDYFKPGGGGKPQPYLPPGNGDKSGEYTKDSKEPTAAQRPQVSAQCHIQNARGHYNFRKSTLVKKVTGIYFSKKGISIKATGQPNSVTKKIVNGLVVSERYYDDNGNAYLDIDYTNHNNPKAHPFVPHIHRWRKNENGVLQRMSGEEFK